MARILMLLLLVAVLVIMVRLFLLNPDQAASQATLAGQQDKPSTLQKVKKDLDQSLLQSHCLNAIQMRYASQAGFRVKALAPGRYLVTVAGREEKLACRLDEKGQVILE